MNKVFDINNKNKNMTIESKIKTFLAQIPYYTSQKDKLEKYCEMLDFIVQNKQDIHEKIIQSSLKNLQAHSHLLGEEKFHNYKKVLESSNEIKKEIEDEKDEKIFRLREIILDEDRESQFDDILKEISNDELSQSEFLNSCLGEDCEPILIFAIKHNSDVIVNVMCGIKGFNVDVEDDGVTPLVAACFFCNSFIKNFSQNYTNYKPYESQFIDMICSIFGLDENFIEHFSHSIVQKMEKSIKLKRDPKTYKDIFEFVKEYPEIENRQQKLDFLTYIYIKNRMNHVESSLKSQNEKMTNYLDNLPKSIITQNMEEIISQRVKDEIDKQLIQLREVYDEKILKLEEEISNLKKMIPQTTTQSSNNKPATQSSYPSSKSLVRSEVEKINDWEGLYKYIINLGIPEYIPYILGCCNFSAFTSGLIDRLISEAYLDPDQIVHNYSDFKFPCKNQLYAHTFRQYVEKLVTTNITGDNRANCFGIGYLLDTKYREDSYNVVQYRKKDTLTIYQIEKCKYWQDLYALIKKYPKFIHQCLNFCSWSALTPALIQFLLKDGLLNPHEISQVYDGPDAKDLSFKENVKLLLDEDDIALYQKDNIINILKLMP